MSELDVSKVLNDRRLVLCGGSGGVGKTTTAAALGVVAAGLGRRTLVLTIDPARRLANAMGVSQIGHEPTAVPGVSNLWVMMLDAGQSIDALVSQHAPDQQAGEALLNNPYYRQISASVAGSREFIAMEKLHDLLADERFDLLIVDTPPAQHALDFLDAPKRLLELLDGSGLGLLLRTTSVANRLSFGLLGRSQKQFAKLFEQLTGHRLMLDLSAFYETFEDVIVGFRSRAATMQRTLRSADVAFLLVLIPQADAMVAAQSYFQRLRAESMTLAGLLFNQVLPIQSLPISAADATAALRQTGLSPEQVDGALASYGVWRSRAQEQDRQMQQWRDSTGVACARVPRFGSAIGSIDDLQRFAAALVSV
ncbi:MAG: ArsA family ATPase [Pseudomonadales bacterium]